MKFSHSIQFNAVPDWSSYYISYSNLKKLSVGPCHPSCTFTTLGTADLDWLGTEFTNWKNPSINRLAFLTMESPPHCFKPTTPTLPSVKLWTTISKRSARFTN